MVPAWDQVLARTDERAPRAPVFGPVRRGEKAGRIQSWKIRQGQFFRGNWSSGGPAGLLSPCRPCPPPSKIQDTEGVSRFLICLTSVLLLALAAVAQEPQAAEL